MLTPEAVLAPSETCTMSKTELVRRYASIQADADEGGSRVGGILPFGGEYPLCCALA